MLTALGTSSVDAKQAVRLRHFLLAAATYAICIPLVGLANYFALVARQPTLIIVAAVVALNVSMYLAIRLGWNLRFADPSLTGFQTLAAIAILMYAVYSFDVGRGFVLGLSMVVLMFGVFRFKTREFVFASLEMLAGYALVINFLMWLKPGTVDVRLEWFQWGGLAAVLPCFAMVGGHVSELRQRLRRSNEELLSALAAVRQVTTHDNLTGLPNRALFTETLQHALAQAERHGRELALVFMDLDRFKNINDTLGHAFGDRVLQETAKRLLSCTSEGDAVARLGGDEFVLLVEEYGKVEYLADIGNDLLGAISEPTLIDGQELNLSVSIGICTYPADGRDAKTLLANADIAMYRAKEQGRNGFCFYSADLNLHTAEKLALEAALKRALDRGEFLIFYQPKVEIETGEITGVEALLRWDHPDLGMLLPERFIGIAEETGLIVPIGLWTLREVCTRARIWQECGFPRIPVAVNLSASQFRHERLVLQLAEILDSTGIEPGTLELEITESMVMQNPEQAAALMSKLREMGVRITIDDFGTGYSSLGCLKRFPIDSLKVDRSFVRDLPYNGDDIAITRAVIAMAHSLQMNVIAEGVEHLAQYELLRIEGCDEFQGYLCRPPLAEEDLLHFLRDGMRKTPVAVAPEPALH
jgi:diguanylate cyclase (GGDEF)-like protein